MAELDERAVLVAAVESAHRDSSEAEHVLKLAHEALEAYDEAHRTPTFSEKDMRGISNCHHGSSGWHAYGAGPCFDTHEQALAYRDKLDDHGISWKSQDDPWPLKPHVPTAEDAAER